MNLISKRFRVVSQYPENIQFITHQAIRDIETPLEKN